MSSGLLQVFVELGKLHGTSNYVLYCGFNKGHSSKFHEVFRVRKTPEECRRTYRLKRCGNNNKDEDNSPKTLNDKDHQALFQKFRLCVYIYIYICVCVCVRKISGEVDKRKH